MPRKQRFKPSRKPKPTPQNEDALTVRQPDGASAHNSPTEDADARDVPQARDSEASLNEPDTDQGSR
jgi:hypothetical protein